MRTTTILLSALILSTDAFSPGSRRPERSTSLPLAKNPVDGFFSFLKEGKKNLVKSLAGEYDAALIQSKIDTLIAENPVLMFSFTT